MLKKDRVLSGILSFQLPGLGQFYCGRRLRAVNFFLGFTCGFALFIIPGVVVWIISIVDAVKVADQYNK